MRPLFDVRNANLYRGGKLVGFTHLNPIKLYTSGNLMCGLTALYQTLEAWWDDLSISIP